MVSVRKVGAERGRVFSPRAGENTEVVTSPKVTRRRAPGDRDGIRVEGERESEERRGEAVRAGLEVRLVKRRVAASPRLPFSGLLPGLLPGLLSGLLPLASDAGLGGAPGLADRARRSPRREVGDPTRIGRRVRRSGVSESSLFSLLPCVPASVCVDPRGPRSDSSRPRRGYVSVKDRRANSRERRITSARTRALASRVVAR